MIKRLFRIVVRDLCNNSRREHQFNDRRYPRKRNVCGTRGTLIILFLLTLVTNLYFRIVTFSDYLKVSFSNNDYHKPCVIPILNPYDPTMMRGLKQLEPFNCKTTDEIVYIDDENILQFNKYVLRKLQLPQQQITCQCRDVIRVDNDDWAKFSDPFPCKPPYDHKADFFRTTCVAKSNTLFDSVLFKMHRKRKYGSIAGDYFNVLLFGIDTVSRSSSIRNLKKTVKYLKDELGAFDFKGHMKTGENTYPNLINLLTGLHTSGKDELPIQDETKDYFDEVPFIWKNFTAENYTTLYAEDLPFLNTFNLKKKGFIKSPVDHYMRPYWLAWHDVSPMRDYKNGVSLDLLNVGMLKKGLEKYLCAGNVPNYVAHLQYVRKFFDTYQSERKFALSFLVEIAHNNQNILALADNAIYDFFVGLKAKGHLNNTVVIVFSDHGPKTGESFYTARMEKSLPMLYISLPPKLAHTYPHIVKNLEQNIKKLTTHYDMYATLRDIVERTFDPPGQLIKNGEVRGYSLFGKMPSERSCSGRTFLMQQQVLI